MSLAEAVSEIADDLEKEAIHFVTSSRGWILPYVKMLRNAVKAAETIIVPVSQDGSGWGLGTHWQAKAREEFSKKEKIEEENATQMTAIVDGPFKCDYVPISSKMPIGAKTWINNEVYQLCSDGLRHCPGAADAVPVKP